MSVETIYNGFGSKKALLREAMDVAVVGDAEPIPFVERPEFAALGEGTLEPSASPAASATVTAASTSARRGIWQAIVEAASSDPEVDEWRLEMEQASSPGCGPQHRRWCSDEQLDEQLVTMLWVLYSPETYRKLTSDEGFDRAQYEAFLIDAATRLAGRR